MNERAFRLDFFVAIGALLISVLTMATLIYQTHVISAQYAATIWPYLDVRASYGFHSEDIVLRNDGLGPALIQSAVLTVDGKPADSWNQYILALGQNPEVRAFFLASERAFLTTGKPIAGTSISVTSVGAATTLRPGDDMPLVSIAFPKSIPASVFFTHKIALDFCYCSLNGSCWNVHAAPSGDKERSTPVPVENCTANASIDSRATLPAPKSSPLRQKRKARA